MGVQERRHGAITVITIDRPQAHNAVDHATAVDLADAIRRFGADDAAVLVLTGAGPTSFCAGADLKGIPELLGDDEFCTTVGPRVRQARPRQAHHRRHQRILLRRRP